jgi:NADH-quinone oxidoreductase subunit E
MSYKFSAKTEERFQWLLTRYPKKDAVLLPLLHLVQEEHGWLSPEAIDYVAIRMGLSSGRIREVASFYTMFKLNKKGQYVLQVCHNLSCYLAGSDELLKLLEDKLGIKCGETTPDGKFTIERAECLASCSTAPMMQVNRWDYHECLTPTKLTHIVEELKKDRFASPSYDERIAQGGEA